MTTDVRLVPLDRDTWRAGLAVEVSPEELQFVAGHQPVALVVLAKAQVGAGGLEWEPLALVSDGVVVAVLALAHGDDHSELLHLAVDHRRRGRGLGTAAVTLAVEHACARSSSREVRLTVHPDNAAAQRLYRAAGFEPTGAERDGEPVWARGC